MSCNVKVSSVVKLNDVGCVYLSLVRCNKKVAEFCLSEEEYELLDKPKPGDVVMFTTVATTYNDRTSMRQIEIRFLGRLVKI